MKKENLLFVTNTDSDDISVVSTEKQTEIARIPIGGSPRGSVKFDKDKKFGYVSNCGGNTISVIDLNSFREVSKITVGLAPRGIVVSPDGDFAFISNSGSNTLSIVDLKTRHQVVEVAIGRNPRHGGIVTKSNKLIISEWGSDTIAIFDLNLKDKNEITKFNKSISVGKDAKPYSVAVNNKADKVYVANTKANYMSVIDLSLETEIDRVEVGFGGRAIAITPDDKFAFITVENTNEVAVIELSSNKVVKRVGVGSSPRGVVLDKSSMKLYTADFFRSAGGTNSLVSLKNALTVLDVSNPFESKVVGQIQVGLGPCSVSFLEG